MSPVTFFDRAMILLASLMNTSIIARNIAATGEVPLTRQVLADPALPHIITVAHRGCWEHAPENSLAAIEACVALGIDAVENDVRHTRDGIAVIMHDATVDRTTDGHGRVAELSWAELSKLRLRTRNGGAGAALTTERVPTLDAYIMAAKNRIMIVYDVKDGTRRETFTHIEKAGTVDQARTPVRLWTATMFPTDYAGQDDARALKDPDAVWGAQIRAGTHMIMTNQPTALMKYLHKRTGT